MNMGDDELIDDSPSCFLHCVRKDNAVQAINNFEFKLT